MESDDNSANFNLFKGLTYYIVGDIHTKVTDLLDRHGAKMDSYLSEMVSHVIADTTDADDYSEAKELFELPIVSSDWVILSVRCGKQLPLEAFALEGRLFSKVVATPFELETQDILSVWGMIKYHGGKCQLHLDTKTTHLITASTEGAKYLTAVEKAADTVKIVTPDWVVDTINKDLRQDEAVYHPRLIEYPKPPEPSPSPPPQLSPPPLPPPNVKSEDMTEDKPTPVETQPAPMAFAGTTLKAPVIDEKMDVDLQMAKEVLARKISSRMVGPKAPAGDAAAPDKLVPPPPQAFHPIRSPNSAHPGAAVVSPVSAMGLRPRMGDPASIRNTLRNITNRAVTPMNVGMRPALPTGAAKMNPLLGMGMSQPRPTPPDYPFPPRVPGPIPTPAQPTTQPPQPPQPPQANHTPSPAQTPQSATPAAARTGQGQGPRYFGHDLKENASLLPWSIQFSKTVSNLLK